jgi:hypothetical protein
MPRSSFSPASDDANRDRVCRLVRIGLSNNGVSWVWAKQVLDVPALIGMALITTGVIVINVFSKSEISAETQEQSCSAAKSNSAKCQ